MKIFDMHIHMGDDKVNQGYLIEQMEKAGVYGGVIMSACHEYSDNDVYAAPQKQRLDQVMQWAHGYEDRFFPFLWVHPFEDNVLDLVREAKERGIMGYKIICDTFDVFCPESMKLMEEIEKTELPVIFHSGILWAGIDSSQHNRPVNWECLLKLNKGVRFSMGHCSWPWHDECIAMYGKFLYAYHYVKSSEMYFDLTPGTPEIYRKDLLFKLYNCGYDTENNIMFGTDSLTNDYNTDWVTKWLKIDGQIFDEIGVTKEQREKVYNKNLERFLHGGEVDIKLPTING